MTNSEANVGDTAIGCLLDVMMLIVLAAVLSEGMMISAIMWVLILSIPVWILRFILYQSQSLDPWTARFLGPSFVVAAAVLAFIMPLELEIFEEEEEIDAQTTRAAASQLAPDKSRPERSRRHYASSTTPTGRYKPNSAYRKQPSYTGGFGYTHEKPRQDEPTVTLHEYTDEELAEMYRLHARMSHLVLTPEADRMLLSHISSLVLKRDRRFGIERWVRYEFDAAARRQAERVAQMLNPSRDDLMTLTAADIGIKP